MSYLKVFSAQATLASIAALRRLLATQGPRRGNLDCGGGNLAPNSGNSRRRRAELAAVEKPVPKQDAAFTEPTLAELGVCKKHAARGSPG
jgi:hypothetical protein